VARASVGANLLGAIVARPTRAAVARAIEAIAMAKAVVGACFQVTVTTSESGIAGTCTIVTVLVVSTSTLASLERAIGSHEPTVTNACPVHTLSVARALIGACAHGAIGSGVSKFAIASCVVADSLG